MRTLKYIVLLVMMLANTPVFAGIEAPVSSSLQGKYFVNYTGNPDFISNAPFSNFLSNFNLTPPYSYPTYQQVRKTDNLLHLNINPLALTYIDFTYKVEVQVEITAFHKGANTPAVFNETLLIDYNPAERTKYHEKATLHFANAGKVNYRVMQVVFTPSLSDAQKEKVSKVIELNSEIIIERYQNFNATQIPTAIFKHHNTLSNELIIWWNYRSDAEAYELEWAYVDNYKANGSERLSNELKYNQDYNLNRNSTRVQLTTNTYAIPMVYERGYILFRMRYIGKKYDANADKIYTLPGQWSDASFGSNPNLSTYTHKFKIITPHENDKKNWLINSNYAEEGKHKDLVTYMDGTQRNRQTIAGLSTEQNTLVGETVYDHQGREAIQILPAPVHHFYPTENRKLKYYANFNLNLSNVPYSRSDFDLNAINCQNQIGAMNTSSGASNYYSPANPDQNQENAYIPDAGNYPFAQTEYTPDNTGRIKSRGGVGVSHQLNSNHQTNYYYGTPSQEELFMLFGNEVGKASHYKKNMVKDPNGQLSISILNLEAKVIATALAGEPPGSVSPLLSYQPYPMEVDLLAFNTKDSIGNALVSQQTITVANAGEYQLKYTVSQTAFQFALCQGAQICLDCVYDLELKIIDNYSCNQVLFSHKQVLGPFTFTDSVLNVNDLCQGNTVSFNSANLPSPFKVNLPVGSYTLVKSLKINEAAVNAYMNHYLKKMKSDCSSIYDGILTSQLALVDLSACNIEDTAIAENRCEIGRLAMLSDLQPGGQYGLVDWATQTSSDPTSVFNTNNLLREPHANWKYPSTGGYKDENGIRIQVMDPIDQQMKYPEQLSNLSDFLNVWQESFAEALLMYHPEYCYLDWCSRINSNSFDYDLNMGLTKHYNDAIAKGYFAPLTHDPYLDNSSVKYANGIVPSFTAQLNNYQNSGYSMLQLAVVTAYQSNNTPYSLSTINSWISNPGINPGISDQVWENYRAFYLSKKEELQYADRVTYAMKFCSNKGGYNECIGANPFNWSRNGFNQPNGGIFSSAFQTGGQSCSNGTFQLFAQKGIRFPGFQSAFIPVDPYQSNIQTTIQQVGEYTNQNSPCVGLKKPNEKETCLPTAFGGDLLNLMNQLLGRKTLLGNDTVNSLLNAQMRNDFGISRTEWSTKVNRKGITIQLGSERKKCEISIELPEGIEAGSIEYFTHITPDNSQIDPNTGYTFSGTLLIKILKSDKLIRARIRNNCYPFSYCKSCPPKPVVVQNISKEKQETGRKNERDKNTVIQTGSRTEVGRKISCDTCLGISLTYDMKGKPYTIPASRNSCNYCDPKLDSAITDSIVNTCIQQQTDMAYINAQNQYQQYLEAMLDTLRQKYIRHCLQAAESYSATYTESMHHFTLYYYNQAGNLVKTVPPEGVTRLNASGIAQAKSYMAGNNVPPVYPAHIMKSQYWYNSLEQLRQQTHPDQDGESIFFYDYLGRVIASQNPQQKTQGKYSYTLYDALGRIIEVGECNSVPYTLTEIQARNPIQFAAWINGSVKSQITKTIYDVPVNAIVNTYFGGDARNYRGRVASSRYFESNIPNYTNAIHYQYDIHGNVKRLVQDLVKIPAKLLVYEYDLLGGKVNQLQYQPGMSDQFIQKYSYDADNRIRSVQSSRDGFVWDLDATYTYYKHGPLARTELGQNKVQGQDFVYTIQGWIKGVNSPILDIKTDPGQDGVNASSSKDAASFLLRYYTQDYKPIGSNVLYEPTYSGTAYHRQNKDLFNGNIQSMITGIATPVNSNTPMGIQATAYTYDQLNRIQGMQVFDMPDILNNSFVNATGTTNYFCNYSYDANGNIKTLKRNGSNTSGNLSMDDLQYHYQAGSNKLNYVGDNVSSAIYPNDLDAQSAGNYSYDKLGNLIGDQSENMQITWNVFGKIKQIKKGNATTTYTYNSLGNRVMKVHENASQNIFTTTFYIEDANGNTLATYEANGSNYTPANVQFKSVFLYGAGRLGEWKIGYNMNQLDSMKNLHSNRWNSSLFRGNKRYELSNHLGNVLATISDRKLALNPGSNNPILNYSADLWMATDYYPFGSSMPGRTFAANNYSFGFNGKENDNEIKGDGNQQDYGMRIYDPRLGKFLSVDPLRGKFAFYTPYQFAGNKPIVAIDLDGLEDVWTSIKHFKTHDKNPETIIKGDEQYAAFRKNWAAWLGVKESMLPKSGSLVTEEFYDENNKLIGIQYSYLPTTEIIEYKENAVVRFFRGFEGWMNSIKGNSYGEWEGKEGFDAYVNVVGKAGELADEAAPFCGPFRPEVELLAKGLGGAEVFMRGMAEIELKGVGSGLKYMSIEAIGIGAKELVDKIPEPKGSESIFGTVKGELGKQIDEVKDKILENENQEKK